METILDNYLDEIQTEMTMGDLTWPGGDSDIALGVSAGVGSLMVIISLVRLFSGLSTFKKSLKVDKKRSAGLNKILGSGNKWVVQVVPEPSPNAFAAGGRYVFITSGLIKILNEREQMAVLLHEVYHNEKKHIYKKLAYEYSLYYLLIYIITLLTPGVQLFWLAIMAFQMSLAILKIPYAIIVGRKQEYGADENTVRYGYANDLISGFKKMELWIAKAMRKQKCGSVCKIVNTISSAMDEHPKMQKRIENVLRKKETAAAAKRGNMGVIRKVVFAAAGITK